MRKRIISIVLCLCLLLSLTPVLASAASENPFTDVKESDWFYDAVLYALDKGLMQGTGAATFEPATDTSRGMIVTILHNLEGKPEAESAGFEDVADGAWYAAAVNWAKANGVVKGYSDSAFGPNDAITREQLAVILYQYAALKGFELAEGADLSAYADAESVHNWAAEGLAWANAEGLITGVKADTLAPLGKASRAQTATVFMRFCQRFGAAEAETVKVTFDLNYSGAAAPETVEVVKGETVAAPKNPTRFGYTFNGWFTAKAGGVKYDFTKAVEADVTVYALWKTVSTTGSYYYAPPTPTTSPDGPFTVTFESNGGSSVGAQTVEKGMKALRPENPTKEGMAFVGWYLDAEMKTLYHFTAAVEKDITLFAKWSTIDDATDPFSKNVTEEDEFVLTASLREVPSGESTTVLFYVDSTLTLEYFELFADEVSTGVLLYDNGELEDDIPNDGCYTGSFSISGEEREVIFTAQAQVEQTKITTNEYVVSLISELSEEQIDTIAEITESIKEMMLIIENGKGEQSEEEQAEQRYELIWSYLSGLKDSKVIDSLEYDPDDYTIYYCVDGIEFSVICYDFLNYDTPDSGFIPASVNVVGEQIDSDTSDSNPILINTDYVTYRERAICLCYDNEGDDSGLVYSTTNVCYHLEDAGFETTTRYHVTVDDFKSLSEYDFIYVACHGSTLGYLWWKTPVVCTPQIVTKENTKAYSADIKKGRIESVTLTSGETVYWIRPDFFTFYYADNPIKAKIVSLGCCKGGYNSKLADALVGVGATTVTAYSDTVYTWYDLHMMDRIMIELIAGNTIESALTDAKEEYGEDDLIWGAAQRDSGNHNFDQLKSECAVLNIYGSASTTIHSSLINGNFDHFMGGLFGWKTYGDSRAKLKLAGLIPKSLPRMGLISSGFGSLNSETTSAVYQTVLVPGDATSLSFQYDVVSEEPYEWVGTSYNDFFQADIVELDGNILKTMAFESVNSSEWYPISGINFPGGDDTTFHTRWKAVSYDISEYRGRLIVFRFLVQDAGDSIYDTAVLLDSISIS